MQYSATLATLFLILKAIKCNYSVQMTELINPNMILFLLIYIACGFSYAEIPVPPVRDAQVTSWSI